jgi:hypothetical protein
MPKPLPRARTENVLTDQLDDELLVYDRERNAAHRLNRTAAIVWRQLDGARDMAAMVAVLREQVGDVADEDLVAVALDDLAQAGLLEDAPQRAPQDRRLSRRRFIRRVGTVGAAALALPVVSSIVAPEPAAAQTAACECETCECECETCICPCASCSACTCPCGCSCV